MSFGSAATALGGAALPAGMFAGTAGATLATFVLLISGCACELPGLPGSGDDFSFAVTTIKPTASFCAAGFQGSQCLDQAAPATVTISADKNSPRRSAPPRKLGVKLPRARNDRLAFGRDLLKSSEGFGSSACSTAVHCVAAGSFLIGRDLSLEALAEISSHRFMDVDRALGASPAPKAAVACGTAPGPAGCCLVVGVCARFGCAPISRLNACTSSTVGAAGGSPGSSAGASAYVSSS